MKVRGEAQLASDFVSEELHGEVLNSSDFRNESYTGKLWIRFHLMCAATCGCTDCMCVCVWACECSGSAALDESRVQADVSDVVSVQQPGEETLQTQTITAVRTRAILPLKRTQKPVETHSYQQLHTCSDAIKPNVRAHSRWALKS